MPIPILPPISLWGNRPSLYDADSLTLQELSSKLHASMNEIIVDYNAFKEAAEKTIKDFQEGSAEEREVFQTALRQEFQDFIDTIDLKVKQIESEMEKLEKTTTDNIGEAVNAALKNGSVTITEVYDEDEEELKFVIGGEI